MTKLLLLAGLLCDETVWMPVASRLADDADVRPMAFAGFSAIGDMAEYALAQVAGAFAVVGHSMGGRVALEMASRAPERITALALLNTGVHPTGTREPASRGRLVDLSRAEGMAAMAAEWLPSMMGQNADRTARLMPGLVEMITRSTPDSFAGQQRALIERPDAAAALSAVRVPTLLATGAEDAWSPPAQHKAMQALAPHADLVIIPDAGHFMIVEQPDLVAAALRDWLAKGDSG